MVDGTLVVCDETSMTAGKIENNGVENLKALGELIEEQKVTYDYQYLKQPFPISAGVLILSDGRSLFKNTHHVLTKPQQGHEGLTDEKFN